MNNCTATAHTNIALIKYWGKSEELENLPATGSLSLTLDKFWTKTSVQASESESDEFSIFGQKIDDNARQRVAGHVDYFRRLSGKNAYVKIESRNNVQIASGLASSASGFAALTLALAQHFGVDLGLAELSKIARRGSGSAARSLFEGLVLMHGGPHITEEQAFAEPIHSSFAKDVGLIVIECAQGKKPISSTRAMNLTSQSSIFYKAFLDNHPKLLNNALSSIKNRDINGLGRLMEQSTLQMHATLFGIETPLWYMNPTTIATMNYVRELRKKGYNCFFTMDAGPHVKVLCEAKDATTLCKKFSSLDGISKLTPCRAGPGAYLHE